MAHMNHANRSITVSAPGKLNLFLHINGRLDNGYHQIQSVMQFVDWVDTLQFTLRDDAKLQLTSNADIATDDNLIMKAATCLRIETRCQYGVDIKLTKRIPMGGGMGGGSSDAASTLLALNVLWRLHLSTDVLAMLGAKLGADVPFFVYGKTAFVSGTGTTITPLTQSLPCPWYLLVVPAVHVNTEQCYQDSQLTRDSSPIKIESYQFGMGQNDFTPVVRKNYPAVAQALDWLGQHADAKLTGTGGVVYAMFDSEREASTIAGLAPKHFVTKVVKGMNTSLAHKALALCC